MKSSYKKGGISKVSQRRKPCTYQLVCKRDNLVYYYSKNKQDCKDLLQISFFKFSMTSDNFFIRKVGAKRKQKRVYYEDSENIV